MAQMVERVLGKDEVVSSNLIISSKTRNHPIRWFFVLELIGERKGRQKREASAQIKRERGTRKGSPFTHTPPCEGENKRRF